MINEYKMGLNFDFKTHCLKEVLYEVCCNWERYKACRNNAIALIDTLLDEKRIYRKMIDLF